MKHGLTLNMAPPVRRFFRSRGRVFWTSCECSWTSRAWRSREETDDAIAIIREAACREGWAHLEAAAGTAKAAATPTG